MTDLIDDFAALFAGNTDAYGLDRGGCLRTTVTITNYANHLYGTNPMGVYPIERFVGYEGDEVYQGCMWGCVDIDVKGPNHVTGVDQETAWVQAQNLRSALKTFGIRGWIEHTRSGGYHVWVFTTDWCEPGSMRRALLVACEIAEVPPDEVNPKQEWLGEDQLGNYVRLPYPGTLSERFDYDPEEGQVVMDMDGIDMSLVNFVADANENLTHPNDIAAMADHYRTLVTNVIEFKQELVDSAVPLRKLNGLGYTIAQNPPLEGQDRSSRLFKLAHCCKDSDLTPNEAVAVVRYADYKHSGRSDEAARYVGTVWRAYAS